ncbi:GPI transamidase component PIG-T-like [Lytechinus variegatus]|uniref:GPI transamidase component PIG-T-like n=1 Tax=Lytechinus variegatus TaxID=7654 RepID=UPI001BB263DA|nr:GPI transamidase component PIG-T-like [Lytechinus variegatus]
MSCLLRNNLDQPFKVIYTETFPWYMRLYLHTLQIRIGDSIIEPDNVFYMPGRDRSNPYLLEVVLTLPATSDMTLKIDFDKAFLRWTEYPPDANIGFFINSAIVSVMLPSTSNMSGIIGSTQRFVILHVYYHPPFISCRVVIN